MGLLTRHENDPLDYESSKKYIDYVKKHGVIQFINVYNQTKNRKDEKFKWGDEIECMLIYKDPVKKKVYLALRAHEILDEFMKEEEEYYKKNKVPEVLWRPEYAKYMLESTPGEPFGADLEGLTAIEENMKLRREKVKPLLKKNEIVLTLSMFPLIGALPSFTMPEAKPNGPIAKSKFIPDEIINPHPRFGTLTRNIRQRRGSTVCICVPLFVDKNTDKNIGLKSPCGDSNHKLLTNPCCSPTQFFHPKTGVLIKEESQKCNIHKENATQPVIYMDAMAFGMGNCCIQCTFLARDIKESRILYDQLIPICPIMLAITASTPIVRGLLADTDVRWNIIAASVDDRTPEEQKIISKSRYDSCSLYIGPSEEAKRNSDLDIKIDPWSYKTLIEAGIDERLATHVAHLFIRDPLVIYPDCEKIDDKTQSEHFENIQSTNWQTCRFKPPPASSSLGWRVEFRVMEVQLTDFENAALAVFSLLLTRVILSYRLRFYMPISKVDLNMAKAHKKDAVLTEKFYFRTNITDEKQAQIELLTVNEIMNGSEKFVGLIPLMHKYLDSMNVDISKRKILNKYIDLVSKRASGKLMTTAKYLRNFVLNHPGYKQDSVITEEIAYDLVDHAEKITNGQLRPKELLN